MNHEPRIMKQRTPTAIPPYKKPFTGLSRKSFNPQPHEAHPKCHLTRVHLLEGYDDGGDYWGGPNDLWCAWSPCRSVEFYARALSRHEAAETIKSCYPQLDLFRN